MPTINANAKPDASASKYMILLELEGAAVNGREHLLEAAKVALRPEGQELPELEFIRHCVHASPSYIIERIATKLGLSNETAGAITAEYHTRMSNEAIKIHPNLTAVLDETDRRGIRAHALTVLPEAIAESVMERSGLAARGVKLVHFPENERHFPRTECWLKIPRSVNRAARSCIAVAGSRDAGRSALSAGMRCLILPDRFTSYQDFSGVDAVLDTLNHVHLAELIDAIT